MRSRLVHTNHPDVHRGCCIMDSIADGDLHGVVEGARAVMDVLELVASQVCVDERVTYNTRRSIHNFIL